MKSGREKPAIMFAVVSIVLFFFGLTLNVYATSVKIEGRQILVDGKPFTIKGVGYSPVPIGVDPETTPPHGDYFTEGFSTIYERDLPLLRQMGANTIRLHGWNNTADHNDFQLLQIRSLSLRGHHLPLSLTPIAVPSSGSNSAR